MRIVSLLPSATEIVYALGLDDQLVGVTFECDEPARARHDKAVVVGGRDTSAMTPGEIDAYVRAQAAAGADLYHLHRDALAGLDPDLILTQDLCWVCALPSATVADALDYLGCSAEVARARPALARRGARHDPARRRARPACRIAPTALVAVAAGPAGRGARPRSTDGPRPRVAVVEWVDPPFPGGHWVPDLVAAAGGEPVAALPGQRSRPMSWDEIAAARPDVVVVSPCGYHLDGATRRRRSWPRPCPVRRSGRSTATAWSCVPARGWSTVSRRSPRCLHPDAVPAQSDRVRRVR